MCTKSFWNNLYQVEADSLIKEKPYYQMSLGNKKTTELNKIAKYRQGIPTNISLIMITSQVSERCLYINVFGVRFYLCFNNLPIRFENCQFASHILYLYLLIILALSGHDEGYSRN